MMPVFRHTSCQLSSDREYRKIAPFSWFSSNYSCEWCFELWQKEKALTTVLMRVTLKTMISNTSMPHQSFHLRALIVDLKVSAWSYIGEVGTRSPRGHSVHFSWVLHVSTMLRYFWILHWLVSCVYQKIRRDQIWKNSERPGLRSDRNAYLTQSRWELQTEE